MVDGVLLFVKKYIKHKSANQLSLWSPRALRSKVNKYFSTKTGI